MYIESDVAFSPPLEPVNVAVGVQFNDAVSATPLEYEAFTRNAAAGTTAFKCYDSRGAVVWLTLRQEILEEAVFGEMARGRS